MAKSANLNIRMKPEIKDKAEEILNALLLTILTTQKSFAS